MAELFGFNRDGLARVWRAVLAVERYVLPRRADQAGGDRTRRPPRTYRRFTLTEQLDAGNDATVEWDDGTTGTVYDRDTCCWGLEGETGEAAPYPNDDGDGIEWRVTKNPGQGIYKGTLADAETAAGDVNVEIAIDGSTITLSAALAGDPGTDMQWPDGATVFVGHFRGDWVIVAIWACPEDEP